MDNRQHKPYTITSRDSAQIESPMQLGDVYLFQLSDITARMGWACAPHIQVCHELVLITEGSVVMSFNDERFTLSAGEMVLIPEKVLHDVRYVNPRNTRMLLIGFRFAQQMDEGFVRCFTRAVLSVKEYTPLIRSLMEYTINEYYSSGRSMQMLQSCVNTIINLTAREYDTLAEHAQKDESYPTNEGDTLMFTICQYIKDHAMDVTCIDDVARRFSYSCSYLSHHFRSEIGCSLKEYLNHYRFQYVFHLMQNSDLSLTQIAEKMHFQSIHTFSRSFRSRYGISPSEYRRKLVDNIESISEQMEEK